MTLASMITFLKNNWLMLILLSVIGGFVGIHIIWYVRPSDVKSLEDLNARLTDGQPTVVEFYTNL